MINIAVINLNDLGSDFIQKVSVMGDNQYSSRIIQKISFQPGNGIEI